MTTITRIAGNARMSAAVIVGNLAFLKGVTPRADAGDDVVSQTKDVLVQTDALLAKVGSDRTKLVSCMIWLKDIGNVKAVNEIYDAWVDAENLPVRACVQAAMGQDRYEIEIQVTAAI